MKSRHVEMLLVMLIASGVGAHIGTFVASMTFR
jgi:hypothetical protein